MTCYALFDTEIGRCAIAWGERGIVGVQFPEATDAALRKHMTRRFADAVETAPPAEIQQVIGKIGALMRGERTDLANAVIDMQQVPDFNRRVYEIARSIPPGRTLTYGDIAHRLGDPQAARDVGQALGRNPFPIIVPCHRVVAAGGRTGGFSGGEGVKTKLKLLMIEQAKIGDQPSLFD